MYFSGLELLNRRYMKKETLLKVTKELTDFGWNKLPELEKSHNLIPFILELNTAFTDNTYIVIKNNILNEIKYHLYILKKYGNFDSRSKYNLNDGNYLIELWGSFINHLLQKSIDTAGITYSNSEHNYQKGHTIKSEAIIHYLEWLSKKIEITYKYGDLVLLFYKVQDIFLELYVKQN